MPTAIESWVAALEATGATPEELGALVKFAGARAEIEKLKAEDQIVRGQREVAMMAAAQPFDERLQAIKVRIWELEQLVSGAKQG